MSLAVSNFSHASAMRVIFLFKVLKNWCRVQHISKKFRKTFCLLDNCIWSGCCSFSLLQRENLSSAISVLTNSPNISNIKKRDIFQLIFSRSDKSAVVQISNVFNNLTVKWCSQTETFRDLTNYLFCSL